MSTQEKIEKLEKIILVILKQLDLDDEYGMCDNCNSLDEIIQKSDLDSEQEEILENYEFENVCQKCLDKLIGEWES